MRVDTLVTSTIIVGLSARNNFQQRQETSLTANPASSATAFATTTTSDPASTSEASPPVTSSDTSTSEETVPSICIDPCQAAARAAQRIGKEVPELCDPDGQFFRQAEACNQCIQINMGTSANMTLLLTSIGQWLGYCTQNSPELASNLSSSAFYCYSYSYWSHTLPANCSATSTMSMTSTSSSNSSSWSSSRSSSLVAVVSTLIVSPSPPAAQTAQDSTNNGAIAGGVGGGVGGIILVGLIIFFVRKHRRREEAEVQPSQDKAQLHSEDIKPDRKELEGTGASRYMLEKQGIIAEMPANEEVNDTNKKLEEMPSNEEVGHEIETAENEINALDRVARSTGNTTLVDSERSNEVEKGEHHVDTASRSAKT